MYDEQGDPATGEEQRIAHIIDIINGECPTDYEAKWTTGDNVTKIYYDGKFSVFGQRMGTPYWLWWIESSRRPGRKNTG